MSGRVFYLCCLLALSSVPVSYSASPEANTPTTSVSKKTIEKPASLLQQLKGELLRLKKQLVERSASVTRLKAQLRSLTAEVSTISIASTGLSGSLTSLSLLYDERGSLIDDLSSRRWEDRLVGGGVGMVFGFLVGLIE